MERTFSVDDLVGGIWRLNQAAQAGMGRTDSEAAFQEFLKRIPSATNLAAAAASQQLDQQQQAQIQQQVQQLQQQALQQAASNAHAASSGPPAASLPPSSLPIAPPSTANNLGGLHRVPSLDLIRQLVNQHTFNQLAQSTVKPETASTALSLSPSDLASLSASNLTAALQAVPALSAAANPLAAAGLPPTAAAAAAAALQLGQLGQLRLGGGSQPVDKDTVEKAEIRRARRMLSNRESARRSRKRKQEHLHTLEDEIKLLVDDKKEWQDKAVNYERRCQLAEEENKRVKEDNQRLREEIHFLRTELIQIVERKNGYYRRRSPDYEDEVKPKRAKSSKTASPPPPARYTPEPPRAADALPAAETPKAASSRQEALPEDRPGTDAVAITVDAAFPEIRMPTAQTREQEAKAAPAASGKTIDTGTSYTSDSNTGGSSDSGSEGEAN